jgi:hypothetical protein
VLPLEVKQLVCEVDHSHMSSVEFENTYMYSSTVTNVFMLWCLIKDRDKYTSPLSLVYIFANTSTAVFCRFHYVYTQ